MSGTIDLSSVLTISGQIMGKAQKGVKNDKVSIELISTDISITTTYYVEVSISGVNWGSAKTNGTTITGSLVKNTPEIITIEVQEGMFWRIRFASGSTGTISYCIL